MLELAIEYSNYLQKFKPVKTLLPLLNVETGKYYYWKNKKKCTRSPLGLCTKQNPQQLTENEQSTLIEYFEKPI